MNYKIKNRRIERVILLLVIAIWSYGWSWFLLSGIAHNDSYRIWLGGFTLLYPFLNGLNTHGAGR